MRHIIDNAQEILKNDEIIHEKMSRIIVFFLKDHDAKTRLSIPIPSPEKLLAEIDRLKKTDLSHLN